MYSELTNLLPSRALRALRQGYFLRLTTVAVLLFSFLVVIHGVLLIPAFLYAHGEVTREQAQLAQISQSGQTSEEHDVQTRTTAVKADSTYLARLGTLPTGSGAVKGVLAVPRPGIAIVGFTYNAPVSAPTTSKTTSTTTSTTAPVATMTVTGTASTRDSLRAYADSLGQLSYVSKADLPISAYAKDSEIPFTITLTGTLKP